VPSVTRRFVLSWQDSFLTLLIYIDPRGNVSADFLEFSISNFGLIGSQVAPDGDQDRFVINVDGQIIVIRRDGSAFAHAVRQIPPEPKNLHPRTILPPVACSGATIGVSNDQARFIGRMLDRRVIVVRPDGAVLGYDVVPDGDGAIIHAPFVFGGSKVATDGDDDLFVVGMFSQIIVIHRDGSVSGHDTDVHDNILPPVAFTGSKIALSPEGGDFVVTIGTGNDFRPGPQNSIIVVRDDGSIFGHTIQHQTVSPPFEVSLKPPS
jgi:hypothetical protein